MSYTVEKGKIVSNVGVPVLPRWFCDDLVTMEVDARGITKIEYFNRSTKGSEKVFVDDLWGGMRFYIENNGRHNSQNVKECEIMPYGFSGKWHYGDLLFDYEQRIVNNSIIISLKSNENVDKELKFSMEFYDNFRLRIRKDGDNRYVNRIERNWKNWEFDGKNLVCSYDEDGKDTHIAISTDFKAEYIRRSIGNPKNILISKDCLENKEYRFIIAFDETKNEAIKRAEDTIVNMDKYMAEQNARYENVMQKMPVLKGPYKLLNDFFVLAPLYHESCKVLSLQGAIRAKTEHYWVWGWDGMSSSFAYSYWDDMDFVENALQMYKDTADKEKGIGHWFARDMSHIETSMISAQGFYVSLLYQYYLNGRDISPYYDFAKGIFDLLKSVEIGGTGLCKGCSLVPDFRDTILETGNDISAFNNSSAYCAIRAMEKLAEKMKDEETRIAARDFADRMKESYVKVLYNSERGYFAASADAETFEQREVFMAPEIKWDNQYCMDLVREHTKEILSFFENNLLCECGICFAPTWDISYDADANQMHSYWPAHTECFARLCNFENRKDLLEKVISWISCWTEILTCPEGIDCYDNVNIPHTDGWTSLQGAWQAYSMRAWYEMTVHSIVGIDFAENGLNIYPYEGEEMSLLNLHFAGKTFDIYVKGSGNEVENVILNSKALGNVTSINMNDFVEKNLIEIFRK